MSVGNIKLIVSDLDGTLLSPDGSISKRNLETILELRNKGILFSIASGRTDLMFREYARQLNLEVPVIACSGAVIRDLTTNEVIYKEIINADDAVRLMNFFEENKMDYMAYTEDKVFFTSYSRRIAKFHRYNEIALKGGMEAMELDFYKDNHEEIAKAGIVKILLCETGSDDIKKTEVFADTIDGIEIVCSEINALDILPKDTSKGKALRKLAEKLNVNLNEVCVLGDYINDISMMEQAGFSVAMGNAHELVKQVATVVTDTNSNDGIAKAIEKYML
jgi:Cof subfamily protein (haloacid dehalogenase superfamily)